MILVYIGEYSLTSHRGGWVGIGCECLCTHPPSEKAKMAKTPKGQSGQEKKAK
jgi:hypothetical protein